jgi:hypothetical protein
MILLIMTFNCYLKILDLSNPESSSPSLDLVVPEKLLCLIF